MSQATTRNSDITTPTAPTAAAAPGGADALAGCERCEARSELIRAAGLSARGGRPDNQDTMRLQMFPPAKADADTLRPERLVAVVCDGMGGMAGGSVASRVAADTLLATLGSPEADVDSPDTIEAAMESANCAVLDAGASTPGLQGMGTTATLLVLTPRAAMAAHVGDSRVYQLRGSSIVHCTRDHSYVMDLVAAGHLTREQARCHLQSNIITRALGLKHGAGAVTASLTYRAGDRFVLCSDGIWGAMPEAELAEMLTADADVQATVDRVARAVQRIGRRKGGFHDNLTLVVVETLHDSLAQPSLLRRMRSMLHLNTRRR